MAKKLIGEFVRTDDTDINMLCIYENKQGLRGTIVDAYKHKISSAMFYEKDRDNTIHRVCEYFGFTKENSYPTCTDYTLDYDY